MKIALWYMCGFLSHKLEYTFSKQNRKELNQNRARTEPEQNKKHNTHNQNTTEFNTNRTGKNRTEHNLNINRTQIEHKTNMN